MTPKRGALAATAILAIAAVAFIILEPGRVFGANGSALGSSLAGELGAYGGSCARQPGEGVWSCGVDLDGSGVDVNYHLTYDAAGCWGAGEERPKRLAERTVSGCAGFLDYLSPKDPE